MRAEGVRAGKYLCFFGISVFTPGLFECLKYHIENDIRRAGEFQLTAAQETLCERERYIAFEAYGERCDAGVPLGLVETQLALALNSPRRNDVLSSMVRMIAESGRE